MTLSGAASGGFLSVTISGSDRVVGDRIREAVTFEARLIGLMGRPGLSVGEGLLLRDTPAIHMCFMRFPIDAIFLDEQSRVVSVRSNVRPWIGFASASARDVLELPAGAAALTDIKVGDVLEIVRVGSDEKNS